MTRLGARLKGKKGMTMLEQVAQVAKANNFNSKIQAAVALLELARRSPKQKAISLLQNGLQIYHELKIFGEEDDSIALSNLSVAQIELAIRLAKSERKRHLQEAIRNLKKAESLELNSAAVLSNWGRALVELSYLYKNGSNQRTDLLSEAERKFQDAERFDRKYVALTKARLAAWHDLEEECRAHLQEVAKDKRYPVRVFIAEDTAFSSFRKTQWFKDFSAQVDN
jgi:hypothetical protein